ncbi:iron (III)-transporter permease HitB [Oceanisphaera marina]|uniref:Iron (III)-transporter permease HitB n=1 Tax=Oceanisphaera marina TaxID=2017550 RepID=A0ABQ1IEE5_9GAMM|nr:iron ABC transporter permease [Oceanisphaera marina]GGB37254.1 iron (III)-transporter permease HitB [Oceanisphaera marina]
MCRQVAHKKRTTAIPLGLLLPVTLLVLLTGLPLLYIALRAHEAGLEHALGLVFRSRVYDLLLNTLKLVMVVTLLSSLIGVTTAWLVERTDLPRRKLWNALLTLPFAVPAFISSYSWISIFPGLEGFGGAILVLTLCNYPLVHLPVAAALRGMDPALEETSRSLGFNRTQTFFKVIFPQLRPSLFGGAVLIALHMLAEFGALSFLNYETFTTAIFDQYYVAFDGASAAMLTLVLLLLCLGLLALELLIRGKAKYAISRKGSPGMLENIALGRSKPLAIAGLLVLTVLAAGVPLGIIGYWLFTGTSSVVHVHDVFTALTTTLSFGLGGAVLAIVFALPLVFLAVRYQGKLATLAERLPYFIHSLPGLVIGLTLVFFAIRYAYPFYQTTLLLLISYTMLYLPLAQSSIRAALMQVSQQLEEMARSLGKGSFSVFVRITLPLIAPGVGAGLALVFLQIMKELTATLLLRPTGVDTLATKVWEHTANAEFGASAPYAALLILVSGLPVYLLTMRSFTQGSKQPALPLTAEKADYEKVNHPARV